MQHLAWSGDAMLRKLFPLFISMLLVSCAVVPPQTGTTDSQSYSGQVPLAELSMLKVTSTWTPTPSLPPATTPQFTATVTQTESVSPTATIDPTPTVHSSYEYILQTGTPLGMQDFLHPDTNCAWMGVGGQVFSKSGSPVNNLIVEVQGTLEGDDLLLLALTGSVEDVGPGGYEIALADHVAASSGQLRLQLYDLSGNPLSAQYSFDTFNSCDKSLVMINLSQISNGIDKNSNYLPFIRK